MQAQSIVADYRQIADDYRVLGLDVGSPIPEAKSAFRRLIKRWHPDVSDQPAETAVHETRRLYQAFRRVRSLTTRDVDLVRRQYFAAAGARRIGRRGRDVVGDLVITRQQARDGSRWRLRIATCRRCGGWGDAPGNEIRRCAACDGLGRFRRQDESWDLDACCPSCCGYGCLVDEPCLACNAWGDGDFYLARFLVPGFGPGEVAYRRVAGLGHPGVNDAPWGDLYLRIMTREAAQSRELSARSAVADSDARDRSARGGLR